MELPAPQDLAKFDTDARRKRWEQTGEALGRTYIEDVVDQAPEGVQEVIVRFQLWNVGARLADGSSASRLETSMWLDSNKVTTNCIVRAAILSVSNRTGKRGLKERKCSQ